MDTSNWSRLEGKQVIMLGVEGTTPVYIGEIVGCDPDIGICIADVGETDPWFVVHGPSSPLAKKWKPAKIKSRILELESIFRQLQSGYFSRYEDEINEAKILGKVREQNVNLRDIICPFSM